MRVPLPVLAAFPVVLVGCTRGVDRYTLERVVPQAGAMADVDRACALGASLGHVLASAGRGGEQPHLALLIAHTTAGFCSEGEAWEAELEAGRALAKLGESGAVDLPAVRDARIREARAHAQAARRFLASWQQLEARYGPVGEACPELPGDEGIIYLLGLYAGVNALLHDRAGDGSLGVHLDIPAAVARGAGCVNDEWFWYAPSAMQAAAWAMVPGLAPEGVDPWEALEDAAASSEPTGVRLGRGLQVLVAANAGRDVEVEAGIRSHAQSLVEHPMLPAWGLLDEYARLVTQHESDLIWTAAAGHRTPTLGELPEDQDTPVAAPDLFAGEDPFAAPPAPDPSPPESETTP